MDKHPHDKNDLLMRLFEEGKQFTADLLKENERLRLLLAAQKADAEIKIKESSQQLPDYVRKLEMENKRYQEELGQLRATLSSVEAENKEFAEKYISVEQQNTSLANLYVASFRLHSTLDFKEVIDVIKEIVINLVGSEMFGIYLKDDKANDLILAASEGLDGRKTVPITPGVGIVGRAAENGENYFADLKNPSKSNDPIACVPLKMQDRLLGMIVVYQLLRQKDGFSPVDFELFTLLADHAATAIYSSRLHTQAERKLNTIQNMLDLLKIEK